MAANPNHKGTFRPLVGGVGISVKAGGVALPMGTLGCFARDGSGVFLLTALHVVSNAPAALDGNPVFQPFTSAGAVEVAYVDASRCNAKLDIAAARIAPGISMESRVLGIGPITGVVEPRVGMRLLKSGYSTGVTEGVVFRAQPGSEVEVVPPPGLASSYQAFDSGDSGAVWLEEQSRQAVCLHQRGSAGCGYARSISELLQSLGMTLA